MQWSNTDIEFPSTSTSDEIEIISQTDDEAICKLLSALPIPSESLSSPTIDKDDDVEKNPTDLQPSSVTQEDLKENEPGNTYLFHSVQNLYKFSLFERDTKQYYDPKIKIILRNTDFRTVYFLQLKERIWHD